MTRTRRAFAFALLAYAFAAIMVGTTLPTPLYALYSERMHFAVLTTTVIYATYAGGVLFALLVFGRWSDAIGRRPVLLAGTVCALASAVVFLVADSVPLLLVGRVLSGLSAGLFTGTATAAVIEAAPPSWRTRAPAVATVANIGGLGAGPVLAGILAQYAPAPLQLTFVVHIALVRAGGRRGAAGAGNLQPNRKARPATAFGAARGSAGVRRRRAGRVRRVRRHRACSPRWRRRSLTNVIGIGNHALAGLMAGSIFGASAIAQIAGARIAPQRAVALGCAILAAGMAILVVALHFSSLAGLIAAAVVSGVGQGISFSRGLAAVAERTPRAAPGRGQLHLLRGRLCRDLAAGDRRGFRRPGLGPAHRRNRVRRSGRGAGPGLPGGHLMAGIPGEIR